MIQYLVVFKRVVGKVSTKLLCLVRRALSCEVVNLVAAMPFGIPPFEEGSDVLAMVAVPCCKHHMICFAITGGKIAATKEAFSIGQFFC